ncbi:hypothetical protein GDO78_014357 [Eleutherodactylus coqui]|uniref:Uncharacterized protein n=1 Tax=Eleutherodactylus coqui TaxID=57060 RepID=A0A8J6B368_ELECQ|nr:hypothetical protein GDO78_014357 [Eleutherodactylus coqui]
MQQLTSPSDVRWCPSEAKFLSRTVVLSKRRGANARSAPKTPISGSVRSTKRSQMSGSSPEESSCGKRRAHHHMQAKTCKYAHIR